MKLYKILVLVGGVTALALLIGAAIQEKYFTEWRHWQREYQSLLETRAKTDAERAEADRFEIMPRQLVIPELAAVDRCVSCHVAIDDPRMADQNVPLAPHSGDYLAKHPPERFGCTVCHRGQGRAMNFREAKATDVFWDHPLLPARYTQSACGICHDPATLADRGAPELARGAALFESKGCRSCHKLNGLGGGLGLALDLEGTYAAPHYVMTALEGERTTVNWLERHFRDPQAIIPGSAMTTRGLTEPEVQALTTYMLSLKGRQAVGSIWTGADRYQAIAAGFGLRGLDGATLYQRNCRSCHEEGAIGVWNKSLARFIPAIRNPAYLALARPAYLENTIKKGRPTTLMANFENGLSARELTELVKYISAAVPAAPGEKPLPKGDAIAGAALFAQQCAGCHGARGEGTIAPQLANPVFLQSSDDAFIAATIRRGRARTAMASFQPPTGGGLTDQEVADLVAHVRSFATKGAGNAN